MSNYRSSMMRGFGKKPLTPLKNWNVFGNSKGDRNRESSKMMLHNKVDSRISCQWYRSVGNSRKSQTESNDIIYVNYVYTCVKEGEKRENKVKDKLFGTSYDALIERKESKSRTPRFGGCTSSAITRKSSQTVTFNT